MKIQVRKSDKHGRGVFATEYISRNEVIEVCPVIALNKEDTLKIDETILFNYYYEWVNKNAAFALGYGSLYNHSYQPNAQYEKNFDENTITIKSLKEILEGEEITVNYNSDPNSKEKVWFEY